MKKVNTKTKSEYLMIGSAIVMGAAGSMASFLPEEILKWVGHSPTEIPILFVQVTGALYMGFAIMNWMAKTVLIGGIYARPLAMGNFAHFLIAGLALIKAAVASGALYLWVIALPYSIFAIRFGMILFTHPEKKL